MHSGLRRRGLPKLACLERRLGTWEYSRQTERPSRYLFYYEMMPHHIRRESKARQNVIPAQPWILFEDILDRITRPEELQYRLDSDPSASHDRPPIADHRIDYDSFFHKS